MSWKGSLTCHWRKLHHRNVFGGGRVERGSERHIGRHRGARTLQGYVAKFPLVGDMRRRQCAYSDITLFAPYPFPPSSLVQGAPRQKRLMRPEQHQIGHWQEHAIFACENMGHISQLVGSSWARQGGGGGQPERTPALATLVCHLGPFHWRSIGGVLGSGLKSGGGNHSESALFSWRGIVAQLLDVILNDKSSYSRSVFRPLSRCMYRTDSRRLRPEHTSYVWPVWTLHSPPNKGCDR